MLSHVSFSPHLPLPASHLPLTLISLEEWALVTLHGADTVKYLQGQLTCDVVSLDTDHFSFAAHCGVNGKMFSNLYVFHYGEGMGYIERRSVRDIQLTELKKYAVFSQTTIIADDQAVLLGVAGFQAQEALRGLFDRVPDTAHPVVRHQETTFIYFNLPAPRFLLITTQAVRDVLRQKLETQAQISDSQQWLALDIEAGYLVIDTANSSQFIPQAANMQALAGISFNKGCYAGQEMVARAKYRGANKRALYWLAGKASHIPTAGEDLELKIDDNWRRTGKVLAACRIEGGSVWVQAILNNNLAADSLLRVHNDSTSALNIRQLPYISD